MITSISDVSKDQISEPEFIFQTLIKPFMSAVAKSEPSKLKPTLATVSVWPEMYNHFLNKI